MTIEYVGGEITDTECGECNGRGLIDCTACKNRGATPCPDCRACWECGHEIHCETCDGVGELYCGGCGGTGWEQPLPEED